MHFISGCKSNWRKRQLFIIWWLFTLPDKSHLFSGLSYLLNQPLFKVYQLSYLAQNETSIESLVLKYSNELSEDLIKTFQKNSMIDEIFFHNSVPDHVLDCITETCQLKFLGIPKYFEVEGGVTESWYHFLEKQKLSLETIYCMTRGNIKEESFHNVWSRVLEPGARKFTSLNQLVIDNNILSYFLRDGNVMPSVTNLHLQMHLFSGNEINYGLPPDIRKVFPNLCQARFIDIENEITPARLGALAKYGDVLHELILPRVHAHPSMGIIQKFVKAKYISIGCISYILLLQLADANLVLPNLEKLRIYASGGTIQYQEYMEIFRVCPNLKFFNTLVYNISEFDQIHFIDLLKKRRLCPKIEEFGLILMNRESVLGDVLLLEAMIKHWPHLRVMNKFFGDTYPVHWCKFLDDKQLKSLKEFARALGIEVSASV